MNRKNVLFIAMGCLYGSSIALAAPQEEDTWADDSRMGNLMKPLKPTYIKGVYQDGGWDANWFVTVHGGINAFVGKPTGCGDLFDRTSFALDASFGKWITPFVGIRAAYEGLKLKDYNLEQVKFQNIHADFMYNISSHFRPEYESLAKWDVIPYVGLGVIRNNSTKKHPFAFSYGVTARYRLAKRLHLSAEIGGTTTFQDFDGVGANNKFGDNLFHASVGLTATIGKGGWKRVIDAQPYIAQNDALISNMQSLMDENTKLSKQLAYNENALAEMRKILEIEGLLKKYNLAKDGDDRIHPKNNYSGLNSLRARLRSRNLKPVAEQMEISTTDSLDAETEKYLKMVAEGKTYIGAPVLFFFKIGTTKLKDVSQLVNLKLIAKVMNKYHLYAKVIGAADSKTGSDRTNKKLSSRRAEIIMKQLMKYNVPESMINPVYRGGIDSYLPTEANRNTCVLLYARPK